MSQHRKFLIKFVSVLATFLIAITNLQMPAVAGISSVDSYFEQHPDQAAGFASQLGINTTAAQPLATTSQAVSVTAEVLDASGKVIAVTRNGVTYANGTKPFLSLVGGALAAGAVGTAGIVLLQNRGSQKPSYGTAGVTYSGTGQTFSKNFSNPATYTFTRFAGPVTTFVDGDGRCAGVISATGQKAQWCTSNLGNPAVRAEITSISQDSGSGQPVPWKDATQAQRDAAIAELNSTDYRDAFATAEGNTSLLPYGATDIVVYPPAGLPVVVQKPDGTTEQVNEPKRFGLNPDADNDGIPDSTDTDDDNDGIPDASDPTPKGETPTVPETETIEAQEFNAENWLQHSVTVFKTKFPFDILGDLSTTGSPNECPKYTFFDYDFELCPIRDMLSILKIPALIAFMIWAFFSI